SFSRRSKSIPLISGIRTSVITQLACVSASASRNAVADAKLTTSIRAVRNRKVSESRSASSSSMTHTFAISADIAEFLLGHAGQGERKYCPSVRIRPWRDRAAMRLDNGAGNRQAHAHPLAFRGHERLEQLRCNLGGDTRAGIGYADLDHVIGHRRRR